MHVQLVGPLHAIRHVLQLQQELARCAPPLAQVLRPLQTGEYSTTGAGAAIMQEHDRGKGWCDVLHHNTVLCHHEVLKRTWLHYWPTSVGRLWGRREGSHNIMSWHVCLDNDDVKAFATCLESKSCRNDMPVLVSGPRATQAQHRQRHLLAAKPASSHRVRSNMFTRLDQKGHCLHSATSQLTPQQPPLERRRLALHTASVSHRSLRRRSLAPPLLPRWQATSIFTDASRGSASLLKNGDFWFHRRYPDNSGSLWHNNHRAPQPLAQQLPRQSRQRRRHRNVSAAPNSSRRVWPQRLCCSQQQLESDAATFQASTTRYWRQYLIGTGNEETAGDQRTATPQPTLAWHAAATNTVSAENVPLHEHSRCTHGKSGDGVTNTTQL